MSTMVRTAGMAHGTADWQLDLMRENENARIWESRQRTEQDYLVVAKLEAALNAVFTAESKLGTAADYAEGTPLENKIQSIISSLELLEIDIRKLKEEI